MRLRGKAAEGRAYERRIIRKILPRIFPPGTSGAEIIPGPWIHYTLEDDSAARRFAQPDALVLQGDILWIFECKLSHVLVAGDQLLNLYGPLAARLWPDREQIRIEVCKNYSWLPDGPLLIHQPADVFSTAMADWFVWHQL